MENRIEERLPQVVEDRLQEAYHEIRERKAKQMIGKGKKKNLCYHFNRQVFASPLPSFGVI